MSLVYFIKPAGLDGPIKIGHSERPPRRLIDLGAWSPWPLELIGSIPGKYADEQFLHCCFSRTHSHREWFHSSPELRAAIAAMLSTGSIDIARQTLTPGERIKNTPERRGWTAERRLRASYSHRHRVARDALRKAVGEDGAWFDPPDIQAIFGRWTRRQEPTEAERLRLDEFLKNPAAHAIPNPYRKKAA